ncbi:transcriptional regulator IFH1-like [Prunus avium]|uniref:Transcriptional regulator IFH1-like n=1 Tax=Prunus avium TaxID=42229 RepID=A0A6P5S5W9_PRUAV|nr:transcriptional regulator IFH1-like [Prunus avium]
MGCFPKCFTTCKRRKLKKSVTVTPFKHQQSLEVTEKVVQIQHAEPTKLEDVLEAIKLTKESKEEENEEQSKNDAKKKVTFDLNTKEVTNGLVESSDEKEEIQKEMEPILGSIISSVAPSHPLNKRYENCQNNEDEYEDVVDLEGSYLDAADDYEGHVDDDFDSKQQISIQEESSESLFSLSIDSRKQVYDAETDEKEVNSPMPKLSASNQEVNRIGSNQNARDQSVLKPIENLTQWKEVKEKATSTASKHQEKENITTEQDWYVPFSPEPTLKLSKHCPRPKSDDQVTGVDTSLSSWLVESETTPKSNASNNSVGNNSLCERVINSPRSREDRPILGAWTTEEIKQLSASTPRGSRSPSPDQIPIIGTVGSYWCHTGQTMDSDSSSSCKGMPRTAGRNREVQKVKWMSTAFEAKLERAGLLEA